MTERQLRLAMVSSHPVQYAAPLYRALHDRRDLELTVLFRSLEGAREYFDEGYGELLQWDVPLLDGFEWRTCDAPRAGWRMQITAFFRMLSLLRRTSFDVLHLDGYRSAESVAGILVATVRRKPWILGSDATRLGADAYPAPLRWLARSLFQLAVRRASGVACMSGKSELFARGLGARRTANRIACINTSVFVPSRERSSPVPGQLRVVAVGRMLKWKRLELLVRAAIELDDVTLTLVGSGPEEASLKALAEGHASVRFLGLMAQTELPSVYYEADVLAIASNYEPFGMVAIEAAACGTPLVADATAGSAFDLVENLRAGWLVRSPDDWNETLSAIRDDPDRESMEQSALEASASFFPEVVAERLVSLVKQCAED